MIVELTCVTTVDTATRMLVQSSKVNDIPVDKIRPSYMKEGDILSLSSRRDGLFSYRLTLNDLDETPVSKFLSLYAIGKV